MIQPNIVLRNDGLLNVNTVGRIIDARVRAYSQGGATFFYILDQAHRDEMIGRVAKLFENVEGVDPAITPENYKKYGLADSLVDPKMPDVILSAKSGYSFSDSASGELVVTARDEHVKGMHGYDPNNAEMHATFIAWGAGIKAGVKVGPVNNIDVAPTMAELMGLKMGNLDGVVLKCILAK